MRTRFAPLFLYETPEAGSGAGAPEPVAVTPEPVEAPPAAPAPVAADAPWSADLPTYFEDEAARAAADRYMREKHQPYVTGVQQQVADLTPKAALYDDLVSDPVTTLVEVTEELYGSEAAAAIKAVLESGQATPAQAAEAIAEATPAPASDPRLDEIWAEREAQKNQELYDGEMAKAKAAVPSIETRGEHVFAPFVVSAGGDFDRAIELYKSWEAAAYPAGEAPTPAPAAPAVLGVGGGAAQPAAVQPKYDSLDAALDATLDEIRAARGAPAVVGIV